MDAFNDPLIDNKDSKKRYRADVLIEDHAEKLEQKAQKEIAKAKKRFGDSFDEAQFVTTNEELLVIEVTKARNSRPYGRVCLRVRFNRVKALIEELEIADPDTGSRNWTDVRQFNLMFGTKLGASADRYRFIFAP